MILKVFSIYDSKAGVYSTQMMYLRSKGEAIRILINTLRDKNHNITQHPADYALFEIAEFDDETAQFKTHDAPINLGLAIYFLEQDNKI